MSNIGALVVGRRLFVTRMAGAASIPSACPCFVVTHTVPQDWLHEDAPFTFVTDGVESAITQAKAVAGEGWVGVAGPNVAQQALNARLIDELRIYLVPVLLGEGIPFFEKLSSTPVMLEDPTVIEGVRVTHLIYRVRRSDEQRQGSG